MTTTTETKSVLKEVAPTFLVPDVFRTAEYYRDLLGFTFEGFWGEPPSFTILTRGAARVMLKQTTGAAPQGPKERIGEGQTDAYFWVTDAIALAKELRARGADLVTEPTDQEIYSGRDFHVRDCDGRILCFGQLL
jgi:predicted enzyme related to lactoylglutathione lyase